MDLSYFFGIVPGSGNYSPNNFSGNGDDYLNFVLRIKYFIFNDGKNKIVTDIGSYSLGFPHKMYYRQAMEKFPLAAKAIYRVVTTVVSCCSIVSTLFL